MNDYLNPHPTDSKADDLLKRILPDYKAEIRRRNKFVEFSKLPIVIEAEQYLKARWHAENHGSEFADTEQGL